MCNDLVAPTICSTAPNKRYRIGLDTALECNELISKLIVCQPKLLPILHQTDRDQTPPPLSPTPELWEINHHSKLNLTLKLAQLTSRKDTVL